MSGDLKLNVVVEIDLPKGTVLLFAMWDEQRADITSETAQVSNLATAQAGHRGKYLRIPDRH
jgi:hypothetical protein